MKVINKTQVQAHEARVAEIENRHQQLLKDLDAQAPKAINLTENKTGKPKELDNGAVAMPGDFYWNGTDPFVVSADEINDPDGSWQQA